MRMRTETVIDTANAIRACRFPNCASIARALGMSRAATHKRLKAMVQLGHAKKMRDGGDPQPTYKATEPRLPKSNRK